MTISQSTFENWKQCLILMMLLIDRMATMCTHSLLLGFTFNTPAENPSYVNSAMLFVEYANSWITQTVVILYSTTRKLTQKLSHWRYALKERRCSKHYVKYYKTEVKCMIFEKKRWTFLKLTMFSSWYIISLTLPAFCGPSRISFCSSLLASNALLKYVGQRNLKFFITWQPEIL